MQITIKTPIRFKNEADCKKVFDILSSISDQLLAVEMLDGQPAIYTWFEIRDRERLKSLAWEQGYEIKETIK